MDLRHLNELSHIEETFQGIGAQFIASSSELADKLDTVKVLVLDWDGVFNNGTKGANISTTFNEADTLGLNTLRFGFWLRDGVVPPVVIISGQYNETAALIAKRDHYAAVYNNVMDKRTALNHFCDLNKMPASSALWVFDDIIDFPLAQISGLRCMVKRKASPLTTQFAVHKNLVDYVTGTESGGYAIREIAELLLALMGKFGEVALHRLNFDPRFTQFIEARNNTKPQFWQFKDGQPTQVID